LNIVGQARSVVEAKRAIRDLQPDLVVLDLQLSDGNGIEILRETKRTNPSIRFVIFTNQCDYQYRQRCSDLGADYFLCKSRDAKSLLAISGNLAANEGN
jgi:DNA-binding NarL/FixJ family response regulator